MSKWMLAWVLLFPLAFSGCALYAPMGSVPGSPVRAQSGAEEPGRGASAPAAPSAPAGKLAAAGLTTGPNIRITSPRAGAELGGVHQVAAGDAGGGVSRVAVYVRSASGEYLQGMTEVLPDGSFGLPIYLGENVPGRGDGEYFDIYARAVDGTAVSSNTVRVLRTH